MENRQNIGPMPARVEAPVSWKERIRREKGFNLRAPAAFLWLTALGAAFYGPLMGTGRLALTDDLHSHILLVPFISLYLFWVRRSDQQLEGNGSPWLGGGAILLGLCALGAHGFLAGTELRGNDALFFPMLAFYFLVVAGVLMIWGKNHVRTFAFPIFFLVFLAPIPSAVLAGLELFLQHASAEVSYVLLKITGTPVFREGLTLHLPGISLRVAPECSGIRSSLVLFLTSLIAGDLFLRKFWTRSLLALVVIPLGILRNALRILTISILCVYVDPEMIRGPIHRHGGPPFFILSLIPFFVLLLVLRWKERAGQSKRERAGDAAEAKSS